MKINIPKVIRPLDLAEYAPEYDGAVIQVWVNPPRSMREQFQEIRLGLMRTADEIQQLAAEAEDRNAPEYLEKIKAAGERMSAANRALYEWHSEIWSQSTADDWTPEQVEELSDHALENDPQLWQYVLTRTAEMIQEYRGGRQKK